MFSQLPHARPCPMRSGAFQLPDSCPRRPRHVYLHLTPSAITLSTHPYRSPTMWALQSSPRSVTCPHAPHRLAPVQEMRQHISKTFRDKKGMADVAQVSKMVAYGRMELEETLMLFEGGWQKSPSARGRHVMYLCVRSAPALAEPSSPGGRP